MIASLKRSTKLTLLSMCSAGLQQMALAYIRKNPSQRMCRISENVFGAIDHKQMLASVIVRQLVESGKVIKYQPIRWTKDNKIMYDNNGLAVRHKHYVYRESMLNEIAMFNDWIMKVYIVSEYYSQESYGNPDRQLVGVYKHIEDAKECLNNAREQADNDEHFGHCYFFSIQEMEVIP